MDIKIDSREQLRGQRALEHYKGLGNDVTIEELAIGDYIFDDEVVFEYKKIADAYSSIMNRKLFNQALDQFKHFKYHFVMIQGTEYEKLDALKTLHNNDVEFDLTRFYKAIANLNTYTTVLPIMETETKAFNMMLEQAKYCFDKRPLIKTLPRKTENSAYNYLYGIKGVGEVTCNDITRKCHVETLDDLFNLTEDMLIEINGINKAKAKLVLNAISNDWESKKEYNISIRFDDGLEYKQEA